MHTQEGLHSHLLSLLLHQEPDNENGITPQTLSISNTLWERSEQQWNNEDYLTAMKGFQSSLEIYKLAWPYIGKSSGSNDRVKDADVNDFCDKSFMLAKKLLFCSYCELDANQGEIINGHYTMIVLCSKSQRCNEAHAFNIAQLYFPNVYIKLHCKFIYYYNNKTVDSARQRLVQCISIIMTIFSTMSSKESIRSVLNDAWMELMLSYEEVPQHRLIARHVATLAIATKSCGWTDALQRPGFMVRCGPIAIPYTPPDKHPAWCRVLEQNWIRILNEYNQIIENPLNLSNVGSGQRGSGHNDHSVVAGRSWKEYVLFGTGSKDDDSDCPYTKHLLRTLVPDAVSLAEQGGGEVIFSRLAPRTFIKAHCGPTNIRLTAHLGLVIPDSASDCQIRVKDKWYSWSAGRILLFDDSFEHEVKNDTDETRVVLLIRFWRPQVSLVKRGEVLDDARAKKEEAVQKRFNCTALMKL